LVIERLDLIVPAAGTGSRAGQELPKQFVEILGKPLIVHGVEVFQRLPYVATKYVTCAPAHMARMERTLAGHGITDFVLVEGGETRAASVRAALAEVQTERVLSQNATVLFVSERLVGRLVAEQHDCVVTVTPLQYNLCEGDEFGERIVPRDRLKLINTPMCFRTQVFRDCHERAHREGVDPKSDSELMLRYGRTVRFVQGSGRLFKVTTALDLALAEALLAHPDRHDD
jgi:2-C-methyl-D-erythritol 4-phosphate cytidylyltransferase